MPFRRRFLVALVLLAAAIAAAQYRDRQTWAERDQWERPAEVLDKLHVQAGSTVADVGAGEGYFTVKMAERVGPNGKVFAEDIDSSAVANLRKLAQDRGLKQVEVIEGGAADDPKLPEAKLDAILVVNAYHEFRRHDAMLAAFRKALKPGGLLGIIDKAAEREPGQPRESYERQHRLPQLFVQEDLQRAGLEIHVERGFDGIGSREGEHWWFLVASKPR